jgi:hypothetical protein
MKAYFTKEQMNAEKEVRLSAFKIYWCNLSNDEGLQVKHLS